MYRVLVVDDEPIVIKSIFHIIKTDIDEAILLEKARNGREAIEKAWKFRPDLVVTDIKMPGINGLDVIGEIKAQLKNTRFIILSAYEQFAYAKEAVALGVEEYLLKPVSRLRMAESIKKCLCRIENDQERMKRDLAMKEKMEKMLPSIESGFLLSMLFFDNDDTDASLKLMEHKRGGGGILVAEVFSDMFCEAYKTFGKTCYEILKERDETLFCQLSPRKIAAFIPATDDCMGKEHMILLAKNLIKKNHDNNVFIAVGIGNIRRGFNELKESYGEASIALNCIKKEDSQGVVLHFDDIKKELPAGNYTSEKRKVLFSKLMMGDFMSALHDFKDIFNWYKSLSGGDFNRLKEKIAEIMAMITVKIFDEEIPQNHETVIPIFNAKSPAELQEVCMAKIMELSVYVGSLNRGRISELVSRANEMIKEGYANELTLEFIAKDLGITPSYFSRLYKQQTGYNFIDYLIKVRIDNAKRLFQSSDLSVKEVSYATGYIDPNYFSRMFKKVTGMTPTEFKLHTGFDKVVKTM